MYMANVKILHLGPNATYIPMTRIGVLASRGNFKIYVGGNANFSVFRYQDIANANVFALEWNIGYTVYLPCHFVCISIKPYIR